jgi:hypothetical protein
MWFEVSHKVMRDKVSHALRDKHPRSNLEYAKAIMLSVHLRTGYRQCVGREEDHFVAAANERLLRVQLPERECANDVNVECILTHELESLAFLAARDLVGAEECTSFSSLVASSTPLSPAGLADGLTELQRQIDFFTPNVIMSQHQVEEQHGGSVGDNCCEECFARMLPKLEIDDKRIPKKPSSVWKQNPGCTKDHKSLQLGGDVALYSIIDIDDDKLLHPQESVTYWTENAGDLPPTFTAKDCEDLLATLDFASSLT